MTVVSMPKETDGWLMCAIYPFIRWPSVDTVGADSSPLPTGPEAGAGV